MPDTWAATWAAQAQRFNPYHVKAGQAGGGEFSSAGGGSGGSKGSKPTGGKGHAATGGTSHAPSAAHAARRRVLVEKIHADEAKIRTLEHELHQQEQALKSSSAQAAHSKAQAAAAHK